MSSPQIQEQRKAQNLDAAVEAMRDAGMPTPRIDEALAEPLLSDEHKLVALAGDLAESYARMSRGLDHVSTHIVASQDAEIGRLQKRVAELEGAKK